MIYGKFAILLASLAAFWSMADGKATDMETIRQRVREHTLQEIDRGRDSIEALIEAQEPDGSWEDVDYAALDRASWPPIIHLNRLRQMAIAYHSGDHPLKKDKALDHAILQGMEYWLRRDPVSDNWWWNEIGAPRSLGVILILMQDELGERLVSMGASKLAEEPYMTGQNRVWLSELVIERGLLEGSAERLASGVQGIRETIAITDDEGIQVDGTFYQHGNLIYNGGYGRGYLTDVCRWGYFLRGTDFAFDQEVSDILATLILDGTGWMIRYGTIDYSVTGRELVRKNSLDMADQLVPALNNLMDTGDVHAPRYADLLNHITRKNEKYPYVEGHKHFWRADYTVNRRAEFLVSLRSFSTRTIGGEIINQENLLGFYLPFGTTLIYRDGTEYDDMMPVWDWRKLPGTTIEQTGTAPTQASRTGQSRFVGGVSNGKGGMSVFDLYDDRDPVSARKSWFFFDEGFVALGADIRSSTDNPVFTTLNQCQLRSTGVSDNSVLTSDGESRAWIPAGERILRGISWVYHDGVGYILPDQPDVYLKNDTQTGSRGSISKVYPMDMESREVFLLGIDHGPAKEARDYVYCVLPVGDVDAVEAFAKDNPVRILSNTYKIQAVQHIEKGLTGITFYTAGSIEIGNGKTLEVDTACLVLVEESGEALEISVANPVGTGAEVRVTLSGCLAGEGTTYRSGADRTEILFRLPGGSYAGSSVSRTLKVVPAGN